MFIIYEPTLTSRLISFPREFRFSIFTDMDNQQLSVPNLCRTTPSLDPCNLLPPGTCRYELPIQTVAAVERCLNLNILLLKRRYLKLINYDSRTAQQCKCEVSIRHFILKLLSLLSLFFLVFSFLNVIFGVSEKQTTLA